MLNADKFLGMTKKGAQGAAESANLIFRLISIDKEMFLSYPEDKREDRICIEIENGIVTRATIT